MFDDFDDFDPDDFENSFDKVEQMPIYKKAMEISDTEQEICDLIYEWKTPPLSANAPVI